MSSEESLSELDSQDPGDTSGSDEDLPRKKKIVRAATSLLQHRNEHFNGPPWSKDHQKQNP